MAFIRISEEEQNIAFQFLSELKLNMNSKFSPHGFEYSFQRKKYMEDACKYFDRNDHGFHYEYFTYKDSRYVLRTDMIIHTWDCYKEDN